MADEEAPENVEAPAEEAAPPEDNAPAEEVMKVSELGSSAEVPPSESADGGGEDPRRNSTMSDIPLTDSIVQQELKEADEKACKTALEIREMKIAIAEYQQKENLTEEDTKWLEGKQSELMKKLGEFEEITRRVQQLIGLTISSSQFLPSYPGLPPCPGEPPAEEEKEPTTGISAEHELDKSQLVTPEDFLEKPPEVEAAEFELEPQMSEDILPKVVVCGMEDHVPRIIVCQGAKRKQKKLCDMKHKGGMVESLTQHLNQSLGMQERLVKENADLEGKSYSLQEELYQKDNNVECMQKKLCSMQQEMRILRQENGILSEKLAKYNQQQHHPQPIQGGFGRSAPSNAPCPKLCPPQCISNKPGYGAPSGMTDNENLERQLNLIEQEVRKMQDDLGKVQKERKQLDGHRQLLKCTGADCTNKKCPGFAGRDDEQACNELKEKYNQLCDDFKSKVTEVSVLRREIEKYKEVAEEAKEGRDSAEAMARCAQASLGQLQKEARKYMGSKEQLMEQDQQLNVAKQRFREAQDELEDLKALVQDQISQIEDYKNRYLTAQQNFEEQRRLVEMAELDNSRISEQVGVEIQRVRTQFQEKLQELTPLPDLLKATQLKLQETQQLKAIAEQNCEDMAREMQEAKDKAANFARQLDDSRNSSNLSMEETGSVKTRLKKTEVKYHAMRDENAELKATVARMEEAGAQSQLRLEEKLHEVTQLSSQLDTLREESARQVARTKERCETVRRTFMGQVAELERQLAQSRALAQTAQKDRNEIRARMQSQINNLNESFNQAQMRIRSLQGNVNFLKTSYSNMFAGDNDPLMLTEEECNCDQF